MRKILFLFALYLSVALRVATAETLTMTDGAEFTGDIVKFDDNGLLLRSGETYTNLPWGKFSQESLKQLTANPKIKPLVEVFIEPDPSQHAAKAEIKVNEVTRLKSPEELHPSIFGGVFGSLLGKFILLVLYAANLYAAFEVSVIRGRPALQVMGLSAVLPVLGPVIFLMLPIPVEKPPEEEVLDPMGTPPPTIKGPADVQIAESSWKQEEAKKNEPQVFARGKFTFNKRFVETKFANYLGVPKADALKHTMELKTSKGVFTVERIAQVEAAEVIFETVQSGQITVPLADIQEIKLIPKPA